jgi:hypothetical protein
MIRCLFGPWIRDPRRDNKFKSGIRIRYEHPGLYFREVRNKFFGLFFDAAADPGTGNLFDPGSGMEKIRIRDKHPGPATLISGVCPTE